MTIEQTNEYNHLCAKFLGFKYKNQSKYWMIYPYDDNSFFGEHRRYIAVNSMKFISDWNWIHEVIEKIESCGCDFKIITQWNEFNKCNITQVTIRLSKGEMSADRKSISNSKDIYLKTSDTFFNSKREAVIQSIQHFLVWHFSQK